MLTGRLNKDSADASRVTLDFSQWLDTNETITAISTPTVVVEQLATWQAGAWTNQPPPPVTDSTPLVVANSFIVDSSTQVQLILAVGTPGLTYKITFVATASSSFRLKQIDLLVNIRTVL